MSPIGVIEEVGWRGAEEVSVEWKIPNFPSLPDRRGDFYDSPEFRMGDERWLLRLYPNWYSEALNLRSGWVALVLFRIDGGPTATFDFCVGISGSGGVEKRREGEKKFEGHCRCDWDDFCARYYLVEHRTRLMPEDTLAIRCVLKRPGAARAGALSHPHSSNQVAPSGSQSSDKQDACAQTDCNLEVEVLTGVEQSTVKRGNGKSSRKRKFGENGESSVLSKKVQGENLNLLQFSFEELQKSLHGLLAGGEDSDVIIRVQGKEFPAHRAILRARSAVFRAMFAHDMVERQSGVVKMEDCDPESFPDFLEHVYTGSTRMISTGNVFSLYAAADKYDLNALKKACMEFVKDNLSVSCFCDSITLAVKHDEKELIECATEFFCSNALEIFKTVEWEIFLKENTTIGNELLIKAFSK